MNKKFNNPYAANDHNNLPDEKKQKDKGRKDKTAHAAKDTKHVRARRDYKSVGEGDAQLPTGGKED